MNDVIKMAERAGLFHYLPQGNEFGAGSALVCLRMYAALVREATKERCAKKCESEAERISDEAIIGIERRDAGINTCRNLAAAIRAMEDKE
jgi:hypothetical protein